MLHLYCFKQDKDELRDEKNKIKGEEQALINAHLYKFIIREEIRTGKQIINPSKKPAQLSEIEIKEITKKGSYEGSGTNNLFDPNLKGESVKGLGYNAAYPKIAPLKNDGSINRLEGTAEASVLQRKPSESKPKVFPKEKEGQESRPHRSHLYRHVHHKGEKGGKEHGNRERDYSREIM